MQEKTNGTRGFINYEKGRQNKAPVYEMIPLHRVFEHYFPFGHKTDLTPDPNRNLTSQLTIHKVQNTKEKSRRGGSGRERPSLYKTYEENIH